MATFFFACWSTYMRNPACQVAAITLDLVGPLLHPLVEHPTLGPEPQVQLSQKLQGQEAQILNGLLEVMVKKEAIVLSDKINFKPKMEQETMVFIKQ